MIYHLSLILCLQLAGEVITRGLGWIIPGPVLGMALFLILMAVFPCLATKMKETALGLLAHLSLLFVPAGVGVIQHLGTLGDHAAPILLAVFASTIVALLVGVFVFLGVARLMGQSHD